MRRSWLFVALLGGFALAQTSGDSPAPAGGTTGGGEAAPTTVSGPEKAPPSAPSSPAASVIEKAAEVPDPEKIRQSADALAKMRTILKEVLQKLEEARNTKDVVKLNCVNEKLTQIKGLLRISEQADVALQEDVAKHEESGAEHEYTKVMIAKDKVNQLRAEAEECIGQLAFRTDENLVVEVEEPEGLPTDPTRPAPPPDVTVAPPPASPTL